MDLTELQKLLDRAMSEIPKQTIKIIGVEGLNFIKKNFRDEGFTDTGFTKWDKRKTEDKNGRDITRYRSNRSGRQGQLNRYGSKNQDRALLTGFATGGDKLRNSFKKSSSINEVRFYTYKVYADRHNEGLDGMPKRQFMGKSAYLENKIKEKLSKELDKLLRQ